MKKIIKNIPFWLSFCYLLLRLPALTKLPIANDESIYIDWGYRMTHVPGFLYYSLYDAKQPFLMWLFGISGNFISDPLYAARFVSVMLGLLTMYGIYQIAKKYFNQKIAVISSLLYISIPIFTLYDRQALLESGVSAAGVWSAYFLLRLLNEREFKYASLLGVSLGLGFFSKTTAFLFVIGATIIIAYRFIKTKDNQYLKLLSAVLGVFCTVIAIILINPRYWETLPTNSRYVFTFGELFSFPIISWFTNTLAGFEILFVFISPLVFLSSICGMYFAFRKKKNIQLILWVLIPLLLQFLTVKTPSQRYIVSLLPLLVIFSSYFIFIITKKSQLLFIVLSAATLALPIALSILQVYSPLTYFTLSKNVSRFPESSYIEGHLSGYGIPEAVQNLRELGKDKRIIVAYAENSGNPESALIVYFQKDKEIQHAYLQRNYFGDQIKGKGCIILESGQEVYFVSRNEQQADLNEFLEKVTTIPKPNSTDTIGIYHLKNNCENPLRVNLTFMQ